MAIDEKIRVSKSTRMALRNMKRGGETYNDVVRRLINMWILVPLDLEEDLARELQEKAAKGSPSEYTLMEVLPLDGS